MPNQSYIYKLARRIRCPKCRGDIDQLRERMEGWERYAVHDGEAEAIGPEGDHGGRVEARCGECRHMWTLRSVHNVEVLFESPDPERRDPPPFVSSQSSSQ